MKAIGIVLAGGNNKNMKELSRKRAIAAMPIAGTFRSIDFALSNMANAHIKKVAVLTQYNARSLNEHLSSSKWWDFGRKQGGLYVLTPTISADNGFWYRGTADALAQNLDFLKNSHEPYVVIASGDGIYKLDYNDVIDFHVAKDAAALANAQPAVMDALNALSPDFRSYIKKLETASNVKISSIIDVFKALENRLDYFY